ncbi:MAG: hypothetical protein JWN33_513 [Candidatus Saccharibacteria bacterium]|nr:hypothetical protein [Candidatus Saccharibacteria bacterium]
MTNHQSENDETDQEQSANDARTQTKSKRTFVTLLIGLVLGLILFAAFRFFTYDPHSVHYHANFGIFINGERQVFKGIKYFEETGATSCTLDEAKTPAQRAHMHDNVGDTIHVHDGAVTWNNFFENIGWNISTSSIRNDTTLYVADGTHQISFLLNGQKIRSLDDRIINSADDLLVSYGSATEDELQKQYASINRSAEHYNTSKDPASCGGSKEPTVQDRLNSIIQ